MKRKPSVCQEIEPALVATAIGDADTATATRVEAHTRGPVPALEVLGRDDDAVARELGRDRRVVHADERVARIEEDRANHGRRAGRGRSEMTSNASGVDLSPNSTRAPGLSPLNSSVDAAMNGISIFSSMRPTIGS